MKKYTIETTRTLEAALGYQEKGYSVIFVGRNKKPLFEWKKYQTERASQEQIKAWHKKYPNGLIAIVTGAISGFVVVDVERGGKTDDLPKGVYSATGGGGEHHFYKYNANQPVGNYGRIRELTDIRGDGGYIIAPPSGHASGGQYKWIVSPNEGEMLEFPYWLIEQAKNEKNTLSVNVGPTNLEDLLTNPVNKGNRNDTAAKVAGKIISELKPKELEQKGWNMMQNWNEKCCTPPLPPSELKATWKSIQKTDQNNSKKKVSRKKKEDAQQTYGERFKDGTILEIYFDPAEELTGFLIWKDGQLSKQNYFEFNGKRYVPTPPENALIKNQFVKLPSDAIPFESETKLLQDVQNFIHEYVQIPLEFEKLVSYYILLSWVFDEFEELPYIRAIGDYGSGKSRFLKTVGVLSYKSVFLNGAASSSSIFRMIDNIQGVVVLDEADFQHSDTTSEIVKILNSGFQKGIPVFRSEASGGKNKSFDPTPFNVFCPKVIATRKEFRDQALESRCLSSAMETLTREDISENLDEEFDQKALKIRNQLAMFRFKKLSKGIQKKKLPRLRIEPRLKQIITPMYSIIDSKEGQESIIDFIKRKQEEVMEDRFNSFEGELLRALLSIRVEDQETPLKEIVEEYNEKFGRSYPIKERKAGNIVEKIFHLKKKRRNTGTVVLNTKSNDQQLDKLAMKYGIKKPEVNKVKEVNDNTSESLTVEQVEAIFFEEDPKLNNSSSNPE